MTPNARSPDETHFSHMDNLKTDVEEKETPITEAADLVPPKTPRSSHPSCDQDETSCRAPQAGLPGHCCRTTNYVPYGPHFPVGENLDSVGEWKPAAKQVKHCEYGYQASWRPSRAVVPIKDIMENCVVTPADAQFRPSIKIIKPGTGAWSEKWRASKKFIDPGRSKDHQWRSCVRTSHPLKVGHEASYRPQIRPDSAYPSLETNQGHFKPKRRHLLPYTPLKEASTFPHRRHIIVPSEWVPPFRIQGEDFNTAPKKKLGRAMVQEYPASHPSICLAWDAPERPGTVPSLTDRPGSPSAYEGHGATPFACAPDGRPRNLRRYIPSGHSSNFDTKTCCICAPGEPGREKRTIRNHSASAPYHNTVLDRNPISGIMPETDVFRPSRVPCGPALYGPAGTINWDIIGHKFSNQVQNATPISEMKDRYRRIEICKDVCS